MNYQKKILTLGLRAKKNNLNLKNSQMKNFPSDTLKPR